MESDEQQRDQEEPRTSDDEPADTGEGIVPDDQDSEPTGTAEQVEQDRQGRDQAEG